MTIIADLAPSTLALLLEIVRAEIGDYAFDIPGNDEELKVLWGHRLIDSAPVQGAPFRFVTTDVFSELFEVRDPERLTLEPRFSDRFTLVAR